MNSLLQIAVSIQAAFSSMKIGLGSPLLINCGFLAPRFGFLGEAIAPGPVILRAGEGISGESLESKAIATPFECDRSATERVLLDLNPPGTLLQGLELDPFACRPAKLNSK